MYNAHRHLHVDVHVLFKATCNSTMHIIVIITVKIILHTTPYREPNSIMSLMAVADNGAEGVRPACTGSLLTDLLSQLQCKIRVVCYTNYFKQ